MLIKRRSFLKAGTVASASFLMPRLLRASDMEKHLPAGNRVVVVLQLSGGNDGLNTVIPFKNDVYYRMRPSIGIKETNALSLTDEVGLHAALPFLQQLYNNGELGILNGVGYPEPDRSHFRSMDIWHSASSSKEYWHTGWLGRYLDQQCNECNYPTQVVELDEMLSLALKGETLRGFAFRDPRRLLPSTKSPLLTDLVNAHHTVHEEQTASYLYKTLADTQKSAAYLYKNSQRTATGSYPNSNMGRQLKVISSLIQSDVNTKVYYLSHGSFDTHVAQWNQQTGLFKVMNDALNAFVTDLKKNNRFNDVLIMTFSEFGRRVQQNASGGTDHGAANNMFFMSGGLKEKGLLNEVDDLLLLSQGDLQYRVDFRQVYATVLKKWLNADPVPILGQSYDLLSFI